MRKRSFLPFLLTALWLGSATKVFAADPIRIAVVDFQVQSDNPAYKYFGKGFAEFTVIELSKSADVLVIAREKRNQAMAELAFSLSDFADAAKQMRVGKLLAAQYLVGGSIFEMGGKLVVTVTVLDVEKGAMVFTDKVSGEPGAYDAITASLTGKVLTHFSLETPDVVVAKAGKAKVKPAETVERFSTAVNALDKKDTATAKAELTEAQKLDPESEAISIYLSKLAMNTAKFKILTEMYFPNTNPAYLGIIRYDKLEVSGNFPGSVLSLPQSILFQTTEYQLIESDMRGNVAYQFPIGENMGMDIEAMTPYFLNNYYYSYISSTSDQNALRDFGGIVGFGWSPAANFSAGVAVSLYWQDWMRGVPFAVAESFFRQAVTLGLLFKDSDATLVFDVLAGYPFDQLIFINSADGSTRPVQAPLFIENTLTLALADRTLFLIFKQLNDLAFDRTYYCGRILAAVEWWPAAWFSFHVSGEGSLNILEGNNQFGFGINGGITFRIPGSGWDIDIGYSYRQRPSRSVGTVLFTDYIIKIAISKTGLFFSR